MEKKIFTMEKKQYELIYDKHNQEKINNKNEKKKNIEDYFKKDVNNKKKI